jgi:uncharacterized membrane protein YfcA
VATAPALRVCELSVAAQTRRAQRRRAHLASPTSASTLQWSIAASVTCASLRQLCGTRRAQRADPRTSTMSRGSRSPTSSAAGSGGGGGGGGGCRCGFTPR